jgi:hypothetical protein
MLLPPLRASAIRRIEDNSVDALHGSNALAWWQLDERLHHEGGESKEDTPQRLQRRCRRET